jgi:glycosyltransferase involved in cell wall biosynthesis
MLKIVSIFRLNNQETKVDKLIDVIHELKGVRGDTFSFLLCNDGPDLEVIRQQVARLELEQNVIFTVCINDMYASISIARSFLIMSVEDLVGIAGLQAASIGVPVVSYQGDPTWSNNSNDSFFNLLWPLKLALHLNRLIEDDTFFKSEADRSRRLVRDVFFFEATLLGYSALYKGPISSQ